MKNRAFTKSFFADVGRLTVSNFSHLLVAIFDEPYAFNSAATRGDCAPSAQDLKVCRSIGDERERMVDHALSKIAGLRFEVRRWPVLDTAMAKELRSELESAVASHRGLRARLVEAASEWMEEAHGADPAKFLGFQIAEIPVVLELYYAQQYLVDVYPGELGSLFWEIEKGEWAEALPIASRLAAGKHLSCITPYVVSQGGRITDVAQGDLGIEEHGVAGLSQP